MLSYKFDSLKNVSLKSIFETFSDAFSDYVVPFDLTYDQFEGMMKRRGMQLEHSIGAFDKDKLIGFTLNSIRQWNNKLTAYDVGTGVIKEYRSKGVGKRLFEKILPALRQNGVSTYLLEIIQNNDKAVKLYKKLGFNIQREYICYVFQKSVLDKQRLRVYPNFKIEITEKPDWDKYKSFWDFSPSWQNSIDSINQDISRFNVVEIYESNELIGYGVIEIDTGDIPQIAVNKKHRRQTIVE